MNLADFFNSDNVELPRGGYDPSREAFPEFLSGVFRRYNADVKMLDDPDFPDVCNNIRASIRELTDLSESIQAAIRVYLNGRPHPAYETFASMLDTLDLSPFFSELTQGSSPVNLHDPFSPYLNAVLHPPMYRIRCDRNEFNIPNRGDIFHVPFEKRHLVGNQRYSIAGLPCLYLGSSVWICWEELGRPAFDIVWVSRFRLALPVTVLDLQFPPHHVWRFFKSLQDGAPLATLRDAEIKLKSRFSPSFLEAYILRWPLIAACSITSESRAGSFFPEYILPQMLLQWVMNIGMVDGIRYFSARMPSKGLHVIAHSNCVFPALLSAKKGHCDQLRQKFTLTEPISWELLNAMNLGEVLHADQSPNEFAFIQMNKDLLLGYSQTHFSSVESKLAEIEIRPGCSRSLEP